MLFGREGTCRSGMVAMRHGLRGAFIYRLNSLRTTTTMKTRDEFRNVSVTVTGAWSKWAWSTHATLSAGLLPAVEVRVFTHAHVP